MTSKLRIHLDTFAKEVEGLDQGAWKREHDDAMACCDLEEMIELGIFYRKRVREGFAKWKAIVAADRTKFSNAAAAAWIEADELVYTAFHMLLAIIDRFENEGYQVQGAWQIRDAASAPLLSGIDPRRVKSAMDSSDKVNAGRPLGEVLNELRNRSR